MWQYAFLVALKENFPDEEVYYDASFFNGYPLHNGFELDRIFNISAKQATKKDIRKVYHFFVGKYLYSRIYRHYFPILKTEIREVEASAFSPNVIKRNQDCYYDGYWADYRYYNEYRDCILKEFSFKTPLDERNQVLISKYKDFVLCSLHVRRGDYLKDPDFSGICDEEYYERAILRSKSEMGNKRIAYLVFSNDTRWCKSHLNDKFGDSSVEYVDWNTGHNSYKDMHLMSLCQINIIANSSFSWWGAYLNQIPNRIVIAPQKYKNKEMGFNIWLNDWLNV